MDIQNNEMPIAVVGLGYVGLPLAVEFARKRTVIGFDIDTERVRELRAGRDHTLEVEVADLDQGQRLRFTHEPEELRACILFIVTVPTPVDRANRPDFGPLLGACRTIGPRLQNGAIVIFESTVYPGATEEVCVPELERSSGLRFQHDFHCGYSPERINPGDRTHRLTDIRKVTSGSSPEVAERVDALYREIIEAGTHRAPSIRVAEAAKVIENTQRDVNIALINELSMIFKRMGIDTLDVLEAAGTKWNFLPFRPGLVGGHCIGVDPYYLTHKAQELGYHPEVILAGRRINDAMGRHVADETVKLMLRAGMPVLGSRVLVLGLTFKENCPDLRNTKVIDLIRTLESYRVQVDVHDPWVSGEDARQEHGLTGFVDVPDAGVYDAVVLAVAHRQFAELGAEQLRRFGRDGAILYDVKGLLPKEAVDGRL